MAVTSDKAAANLKFASMMGEGAVPNVYAPEPEERLLYFVSDVPHLLKTVRNNMAASDSGRRTKFLWVGILFSWNSWVLSVTYCYALSTFMSHVM